MDVNGAVKWIKVGEWGEREVGEWGEREVGEWGGRGVGTC